MKVRYEILMRIQLAGILTSINLGAPLRAKGENLGGEIAVGDQSPNISTHGGDKRVKLTEWLEQKVWGCWRNGETKKKSKNSEVLFWHVWNLPGLSHLPRLLLCFLSSAILLSSSLSSPRHFSFLPELNRSLCACDYAWHIYQFPRVSLSPWEVLHSVNSDRCRAILRLFIMTAPALRGASSSTAVLGNSLQWNTQP